MGPACPSAIARARPRALSRCPCHESARPTVVRPPFPADPGTDQRAGSRAARDRCADDRSPRPGVRRAGQGGARGDEEGVQDRRRGRHLPGIGNRRVGSGARQHALARRPRADGGDRAFRGAVEEARRASRSCRRIPAGGLAAWRRGGRGRGAARRGPRARDQGRVRRAQRNLHRRHQPGSGRPRRHRSRPAPGALHGRHDLVAGLDRLPARRMARRRHRRADRRRG